MYKQEQTILILVLAAAGMLLLLLYSPWGSPDLYNKKVYFAENQGVNFDNKIISREYLHVGTINANIGAISSVVNAPKNGSIGDSQNAELNVPDNYSKRKAATKISATNYTGANTKSNRIIAYNKIPKSSIAKSRGNSVVNSETTTSNGGGGSEISGEAEGAFTSNNNRSNTIQDSSNQLNGISSTSVDLSLFSDSTAMQATDSAQKAGSDPGDNPIEPVPVPEGWGFLLALAAIYICIKRKMFFQLIQKKSVS